MRMRLLSLVGCLALAGHGRRMQRSRHIRDLDEGLKQVGKSSTLKALRKFLRASSATTAWQLHSADVFCKRHRNRSGKQLQSSICVCCRLPTVEMSSLPWQSVVSKTSDDWRDALSDAVEKLSIYGRPDIAFLFVPNLFEENLKELISAAAYKIAPGVLVGVVGSGVIGCGIELDHGEGAISVLAGKLPRETEVRPFIMSGSSLPVWNEIFESQPQTVAATDENGASTPRPGFFVFADPYSPVTQALPCLDEVWPASVVAGGLSCPASRSNPLPSLAIYQAGSEVRVLPTGSLVGIGIRGPNVELHSATAQGAMGIGPSFAVTAGGKNVVSSLDGSVPMSKLQEVVGSFLTDQRGARIIAKGLMIGLQANSVIDGGSPDEEEFLVRQILGSTREGGIAIGDQVTAGKTRLRFHIRDEEAATDELRLLLARYNLNRQFSGRFAPAEGRDIPTPLAALCFSCASRGSQMFSTEHPAHDATAFGTAIGKDVPLAGFFCNGEIGPIGVSGLSMQSKQTHLHGFSAVFAMLWNKTQIQNVS